MCSPERRDGFILDTGGPRGLPTATVRGRRTVGRGRGGSALSSGGAGAGTGAGRLVGSRDTRVSDARSGREPDLRSRVASRASINSFVSEVSRSTRPLPRPPRSPNLAGGKPFSNRRLVNQ